MLHDNVSTFHLQHQEGFHWLGPPSPTVGEKSFVIKLVTVSPRSLKIPIAREWCETRVCGGVLGLEQVGRGPVDSWGASHWSPQAGLKPHVDLCDA